MQHSDVGPLETLPPSRWNRPPRAAARFDSVERGFLLRQRGIADGVLAGLEALGIGSLDELAAIGADELCRRMQAVHGWDVWGNRRRMLQAAIEAARASGVRGGVERQASVPANRRGRPE